MSDTAELPRLTRLSRSWICTPPNGANPREFFDKANAMKALNAGWRVELAAEYLARLNRDARS